MTGSAKMRNLVKKLKILIFTENYSTLTVQHCVIVYSKLDKTCKQKTSHALRTANILISGIKKEPLQTFSTLEIWHNVVEQGLYLIISEKI